MDLLIGDISRVEWNDVVADLPGRHILQSWEWGAAKGISGWIAAHKVWRDPEGQIAAAAQILMRSITLRGFEFPIRIMYIPRGPLVCDWTDASLRRQVLGDLYEIGKKNKAIFIKVDPEVEIGRGIPGEAGVGNNPVGERVIRDLQAAGWVPSPEQVQFRNTMLIDLRPEIDQLQANMKQKTRYNVRLAGRRGVTIRKGELTDLELLFKMYAETSIRDGFTIRNQDYYLSLWSDFIFAGMAEPLLAEVEGEPVAGVIIFRFGRRAWYMFGMSCQAHREKMPNYLLQWEAMVRAKQAGCVEYDLWGAPNEFIESDPLWGVYRFKAGLGAEVVRFIGAWDLPLNPLVYRAYTQLIPRILDLMRSRGEQETRGVIQAS